MTRPATTHYGIAKYGERGTGDAMDVYGVYNPAMDTIDGLVFQHKQLIDALEGRMDSAEDRLTALETRVTNLEKRMDTAEQNITKLQQDLNALTIVVNNQGKKQGVTLQDIVNKVYGGGIIGSDGHVTWGDAGKIAVGNMSMFGNGSLTSYIRTRSGTQNDDVRVN